jgi:PAS domain S-box-containing protein
MSSTTRTILLQYGGVVVFTALAVLVRSLLDPLMGDALPLVTLFGAVAAAVWFSGYRPALIVVVLGYLACAFLFIEPRGTFGFTETPNLVGLVAYLVTCAIIIGFGEALRVAQRRADQQQESLREEKARLHATLTGIGDAVIVTDAESRVRLMNPVAQALTGWEEEALGQPLDEVFRIINEETRKLVENPVSRVMREGTVVGLANHTVLIGKDGTERPIDDSAAPIKDVQGRVVGVVLVFRDNTERRRAEEALRESEGRKTAIVEMALNAIITIDQEGKIVEFNPAAQRMFGYSHADVLGREMAQLIVPPGLRDQHRRGLARYLATGEGPVLNRLIEMPALRADGTVFSVELAITRIPTKGPPLFTGYLRDLTERKRIERRRTIRLAVTEILSQAASLQEAAPRLLQAVGENLGWDVGAFWTVADAEAQVLTCSELWYTPSMPVAAFVDASRRSSFAPGIGLPGRVRSSGKAAWIPDVAKDDNFPRGAVAVQEGLHGAFGFPILLGAQVVGVIEFFSHEIQEPDPDLLEMVTTIGGQVGQFMDRKRAEQAVRESEQRFVRFMQHLPGLAWIKDCQGRYVYANDAAVKVFRCTRGGLYGRTDNDVFLPETAAQFKKNDSKALASEAGVQVIETLEHQDGVVHHSIVSKFPILGPEGSPAFVGGMAIDITDRLRAEKVLAESEERFRQLAENINEVFWMTDPQTTQLLYISPAYERVWGRSCQSLYENPRSFMDAIHPEDQERVRSDVLERQSRGEQIDKEYRVVRPDGSIRWVRDRAFPVKDAAGQFYRLVGIIDDFTEKKQAEEALRDANRRKDEFLATLAHELRNPLAPIRNAVELMRGANDDVGLMEKARSIMERQVAQMVRLVDDLLDMARITKGKLQLRQDRIELAAVVRSAIEIARPLIDVQAHELTVTLSQEPVHLEADPIRLAQVFSNLLNNAVKYTEKGGHIWLTAERQGGKVVVSVRDTGIGFTAEHLPRLFEMFSQVEPALERSQGGLGIGLALVRGLVELHGGSVEARSAGPGKGSEFTVRLPIVETTAQKPQEPGAEEDKPCAGPKCRILIADDLRDAVESLAMMLRLAGHDIRTAHDGLEAVQEAAAFRPDVVVLDIGMPKMNGYEAARHIRQQPWGKNMVLVALTGWGQEEDKQRTFEAGFDHHLTKPVEPAALEKLLALMNPVSQS